MTNQDPEDSYRRKFIDPVVATTVGIFVLLEMLKGALSFATQKCLGWWWNRRKDSNGKPNDSRSDEGLSRPQQEEKT